MFDFHIHVSSAGESGLLPTEAIRLARCAGFRAVGLVLRADPSTLSLHLPSLVPLVRTCSLYANIEAFAGVELVHVPPALLPDAVAEARSLGAALVLAHGETIPRKPVEAVELGTNFAAIEAGVDILAHPGLITPEDAERAAEKGVLLGTEHGAPPQSCQRACRDHGPALWLRSCSRFGCRFIRILPVSRGCPGFPQGGRHRSRT